MPSRLRIALGALVVAITTVSSVSPVAAAGGFHGGGGFGGGFHGGGGGFHGGGGFQGGGGYHASAGFAGAYHGGGFGGYHGGYNGYHGGHDGDHGGYYGHGHGGYYGHGYGGFYGPYGYYGGFGFGDFLFGAALFGTAVAVASSGPDYIYTPGYGYDYAPPVYAPAPGPDGYAPDGSYYAPGRYPPQGSYPAYPAARDAYPQQNGTPGSYTPQGSYVPGSQPPPPAAQQQSGSYSSTQGESPVDQCARAAEQAAGSRGGFARVIGIDHVDPEPNGARVRGALEVTRDQDDRSPGQRSHFDCTASYGRITGLRLS